MQNDWIQIIINVFLLLLTICSTYYAKRTVQVARKQLRLTSNPVIGIEVNQIKISEVFEKKFKRREMIVELEIANIGNDPAIEILIDGEIELEYSNIQGETVIPARFTPSQKSFLMLGDKICSERTNLYFGNIFINHFFESSKIMGRMNKQRIKNTPWKDPYQSAKLMVYVYYSNNLGQCFKSKYEIYIYLQGKIPKSNEKADVGMVYIPRPIFCNNIISKDILNKEIEERNKKRNLCGW